MPDLEKLLKDLYGALDADTQSQIAVIGGQALSIWANHYLLDELTGSERACLASDDLDFLGRKPEVIRCAEAWNTDYAVPKPFDNTPNSGVILIDHDMGNQPLLDENGEPLRVIIDFLPSVHGVSDKEAVNGFDELVFDDFRMRLLTPALCLKSRMFNIYSLHYSDALIQREIVRIKLAATATKYYLLDLLEDPSNKRKAIKWANLILDTCLTSWGVRLAVKYGIEPLDAIPEQHWGFGESFQEGHFAAMREKILKKRASYKARLGAA